MTDLSTETLFAEADGKLALAKAYYLKGDLEQAFHSAGESYEAYQRTAEQGVNDLREIRRFSGIAQSLNVLGAVSNMNGQFEQGEALFDEIIGTLTKLIDRDHKEELCNLYTALSNRAISLRGLKRLQEGLAEMKRAIAGFRELQELAWPRAEVEISRCLNILSMIYSESGDSEGALQAVDEAVDLGKSVVARTGSAADTLHMASAYNTRGQLLRQAGNFRASLDSCEAAISALAPIFARNSRAYSHQIGAFLNNYEMTRIAGGFGETSELVLSVKKQLASATR